MKRLFLLPFSSLLLTACITSSPEVLLSPEPVGSPQTTGAYPKIGVLPQAETRQITPTERTATKTQLSRSAAAGEAQAATTDVPDYEREVAAMKKLAADEQKRRLKQIESRKY